MLRFCKCERKRGQGSVLQIKYLGSHNAEIVVNFLDEIQTNLNLARLSK